MTKVLVALERLKYQCFQFFSVVIDPILFKLSENQVLHNILEGNSARLGHRQQSYEPLSV